MRQELTTAAKLRVPLEVRLQHGKSWGSLRDLIIPADK